jgi:hypothetical protein
MMGFNECNDLLQRYPAYLASKALHILERFEYIQSLPNTVYFLFSRLTDDEPFNKKIRDIERNKIKKKNAIRRCFEFARLPTGKFVVRITLFLMVLIE